jgi:hypothetical protein
MTDMLEIAHTLDDLKDTGDKEWKVMKKI